MKTEHLSDEQFTEHLAGRGTTAVTSHLDVCTECRDEARRVADSIASFNRESLAWAEMQQASRISPRRRILGWYAVPAWAMSAIVVVGGMVGAALHLQRSREVTFRSSAPEMAAAESSPDTIAQDNQLLRAIDRELRWSDSERADLRSIQVDMPRGHRRSRSGRVVN